MKEINAKEAKVIAAKNKKLAEESDKNILQILRESSSSRISKAAAHGYSAITVDCNIDSPNIELIVRDLIEELIKRGFVVWRNDAKSLMINIEWKY